MFHSLRSQFIVPLFASILVAVGLVTALAYYFANQSAKELTEQRLASVASVAVAASYPLTEKVLDQMRGLSSLEIVIFQYLDRQIVSKTSGIDAREFNAHLDGNDYAVPQFAHDCLWLGKRWDLLIRPIGALGVPESRSIVILTLHENQESLISQALSLPIATGSVSAIAVGVIATYLATRISNRIRRLGEHVSRIELGKSEPLVPTGPQDEINKLTENVNRMTQQLKVSQQTLATNQRAQLINQLASGMAHQFRNTLTGARLAIQMHQQENPKESTEDLDLALDQLRLAEQSIQSLLQVRGGLEATPSDPQSVVTITTQLMGLIKSKAEHRGHQLLTEIEEPAKEQMLPDGKSILGAILNLALNGIEAMDTPGCLTIDVKQTSSKQPAPQCVFTISDTGNGPTEAIQATMMESFSTTKQEGIGIGLPMAMSVADRYGGSLTWYRDVNVTRFVFAIPVLEASRLDAPVLEGPAI